MPGNGCDQTTRQRVGGFARSLDEELFIEHLAIVLGVGREQGIGHDGEGPEVAAGMGNRGGLRSAPRGSRGAATVVQVGSRCRLIF